jgi:PTS system mannose-specific IID component
MSDEIQKEEAPKAVMSAPKKASKTAVMKSFLNWLFFAHSDYNFERLQGIGFLLSMSPIIDDLYDKDDIEHRREAMQRHTPFFNTEPRIGCMIVGLCAALEERIASGEKELGGDAMGSIKYGLMGPLAGIGDTLFQGILAPLLLSMVIGLSMVGNLAGPVLYIILFISLVCVIGYNCFMLGYKKGDEAVVSFIESGVINKVIKGAGAMGCLVMGALVANFVRLSTTVKFKITTGEFDLQKNFFDPIMPRLLPLILTLLVFKLLQHEKMNSLKAMIVLLAGGIVLGLLRIV